MIDQFGRNIDYARLSLTEACNLHCRYCRPFVQAGEQQKNSLTFEEILRVAALLSDLGIKKLKVTGGEPLVRKDCVQLLKRLRPLADSLTLTTNGILVGQYARELGELGLDGVNVSLDSCMPERYRAITGFDGLLKVQKAIRALKAQGVAVKLNCVPLKPFSSDDLARLLEFAVEQELPLRFIELMPLSCNIKLQGLTGRELRELFKGLGYDLEPCNIELGNGPASYYQAQNLNIPIGFIEPLHGKFCRCCNRVRISSSGFVKPCLYSKQGLDLGNMLRSGASDKELRAALEQTVFQKPREHAFELQPGAFSMNSIGG